MMKNVRDYAFPYNFTFNGINFVGYRASEDIKTLMIFCLKKKEPQSFVSCSGSALENLSALVMDYVSFISYLKDLEFVFQYASSPF